MKFTVVTWPSTGDRGIFIPKGQSEPVIAHPEAWIGYGSDYKHGEAFAVRINSGLGGTTTLFVADGNEREYADYSDQYGSEILRLLEPSAGWAFADVFLKFWLSYVFGQEVELEHINRGSS